MSFDITPNILYTILFIVNCNECLYAEFIGQTSVPYKRIGKHFDLINSNNTSSDALRRIFPNMLLNDLKNPALFFENEHLNFVELSKYTPRYPAVIYVRCRVCLRVRWSRQWILPNGWTDQDAVVSVPNSHDPCEPCTRYGEHRRHLVNRTERSCARRCGDAAYARLLWPLVVIVGLTTIPSISGNL